MWQEIPLLKQKNTENHEFNVEIKKFLPERCSPLFELNRAEKSVANYFIWSPCVFWLFDGESCKLDIIRYSIMRVKSAAKYNGEEKLSQTQSIDAKIHRP